MKILTATDFRNNISDYMNQIVYQNKSFILKKGKKEIAYITPFIKKEKKTKRMAVSSLLKMREKLFANKKYFKNVSPTLRQDIDKILYGKQ